MSGSTEARPVDASGMLSGSSISNLEGVPRPVDASGTSGTIFFRSFCVTNVPGVSSLFITTSGSPELWYILFKLIRLLDGNGSLVVIGLPSEPYLILPSMS